jgi:hypothetical protein
LRQAAVFRVVSVDSFEAAIHIGVPALSDAALRHRQYVCPSGIRSAS